jgi:RecA/RadA recombinase
MSPVDASLLEKDMKVIRDRRGDDAIHNGNHIHHVIKLPIPSPGLMRITGGGVPIGRMTRLWGGPSSGKSLIGWMIISAAQKYLTEALPIGMEATYWNVEKQYDPIFTKDRGVDTERMMVEEATIIEDIAGEMEILMRSCHLHVLDSASFAVCRDELASDADQWFRALDARAWKRAINRIHNAMDKEENMLVCIDHAGTDQVTGSEHALGAKRLEFKSDLSMHFKTGAWLFYDDWGHLEKNDKLKDKTKNGVGPAGTKEADGVEIVVRVNKSRVCRPFRSARLRLDINTFEFDTIFELIDAAKFFDAQGGVALRTKEDPIAIKAGSWYTFPNGEKVQGDRGIRTLISSNPDLKALVESAMMAGN